MIVLIIGFAIFVIILLFFCSGMKIVYPVIIKMIGIMMIMFSVLGYVVKFSGYTTKIVYEYKIYIMLSKIKIGCGQLALIGTIGCALLMLGTTLLLFIVLRQAKFFNAILWIALFVAYYSIGVREFIFLSLYNWGLTAVTAKLLIKSLDYCGAILLLFFILYPYWKLIKKYNNCKLYKEKNDILLSMIVWFSIDICSVIIVLAGKMYYYMFFMLDILDIPKKTVHVDAGSMSSWILVVVLIMFSTIVLIIKCTPLGKVFEPKINLELWHEKDESMYMVMHTYKNAFASITMYASNDEKYSFLGKPEKRLEIINMIAKEQLEKLTQSMKGYQMDRADVHLKNEVDLKICVDKAVKKSSADLQIQMVFCEESAVIIGDEEYITESLVCAINNACEAVREKNTEKCVKIAVGIESDKCYVIVSDNGSGIEKRSQKLLFQPFYSTKRGGENYGLGLSFIQKVARAHGGDVYIKSKKGIGTSIQIVYERRFMHEKDKRVGM